MLEEVDKDGSWIDFVNRTPNPFGSGNSGVQIANRVTEYFNCPAGAEQAIASATVNEINEY
jgi:hypothetical protein